MSVSILVVDDEPDVAEFFRQRFPDLPVVMVAAYGDDERRRQAAEYGAGDFLAKPVDFEHLKGAASAIAGVPD